MHVCTPVYLYLLAYNLNIIASLFRLWPRGAAMAERFWTGSSSIWKDAKIRLMYHRGRMVKRGFAPDTLQPEWCDQNDGLCYIS